MPRFRRQRRNAREASPALQAALSASFANRCNCLRLRHAGRGYRGGIGAPGEGVPMEIARRDGGAALRGASPYPGRAGRRRRCFCRPIRWTDLRRVEWRNVARPRPGLGHGSRTANAFPSAQRPLLGPDSDRRDAVHEHQPRMRRRREWRLGDHAGSEEQDRQLMEDERRQPGWQSRIHGRRQDSRGHRCWCSRPPAATPMRSSRSTRRHCSRSTGSRALCRVRDDAGRHQSGRTRDCRRRDARRHLPS